MEEFKLITLQLALTKGFGIGTFRRLQEIYPALDDLFASKEVGDVLRKSNLESAQYIINSHKFVCYWEDKYPFLLKQAHDCPLVLYYLGNETLLERAGIGVVGTRQATDYGERQARKFIPALIENGLEIVSGMAYGIDSIAHKLAVDYRQASTIAVLASHVDEPSPPRNNYLYQKILKSDGLIVSATHPKMEVMKGMFVARNRIIAGLTRATLVIEAPADSGALTTADLAFGYDREVFAIPGSLDSEMSQGTNNLIKQNKAKLVQTPADILIELNLIHPNQIAKAQLDLLESGPQQALDELSQRIVSSIKLGCDSIDLINNALPEIDCGAILSGLATLEIQRIVVKRGEKYSCLI
jgi:DNA processing protein